MIHRQPSPRRRFPESVPEAVALFCAADPREEAADRRLGAVFADAGTLAHEEIAAGGGLGESRPAALLGAEPDVRAEAVRGGHLRFVFPVARRAFRPAVA
jgi:hypothetical protein